jgi:hypothetical protein
MKVDICGWAHFHGHFFRIGGATSLAHNGVPIHFIEDLGGWARGSAAVQSYLHNRAAASLRRGAAVFFFNEFLDSNPAVADLRRHGHIA